MVVMKLNILADVAGLGGRRLLTGFLAVLFLSGCTLLPYHNAGFRSGYVQVRRGETLYSIAWRFDLDYHELAQWNGIRPPYTLIPGQWLRMNPPMGIRMSELHQAHNRIATNANKGIARSYNQAEISPATPTRYASGSSIISTQNFIWPTHGRVLKDYSKASQGIEIQGKSGQPVVASAAGQVVYSGDGLPSYGNLIIIKHNDHFLTAYGHNKKLLAKEGELVKRGQVIALMGESGTDISHPTLFFEIRVDGQPKNPIIYLPKQ